jgi:iron(III) transport system ATP-binding protein
VLALPGGRDPPALFIVLRPQNISIAREAGPNSLTGQILHSEFLGSQIRYLVEAAGSRDLVIDQSHRSDEILLTTGAEVALRVNMDSAVLLSS